MSAGIKTLSVKQKILGAAHGNALDRPFCELAHYLLMHYDGLDALSAADAARECHISTSTVRRFCRALGYENFADLRRAKLENPENQYEIARANGRAGYYAPRRMYDEVNSTLWNTGRKLDWNGLERLASVVLRADAVLVYALRPYSFILQEFQSQFAALGRCLYIYDDISGKGAEVAGLGERLCHITVSPAGVLFPAVDADLARLDGFKAAVYCARALSDCGGDGCLERYDARFPLPMRVTEYAYLEIYGKYAVMYFFDVLLGRVVELLPLQ